MFRVPVRPEIGPVDNVLYFPNNIDVRICPKNGMTSLKEYYARFHGYPDHNIGYSYRINKVSKYASSFDKPFRKKSFRIAVRRDPVDRFKSACEYIQAQRAFFIRQGRPNDLPLLSRHLDEVIESIANETIKNNHFYTQSYYMGVPEDYDMVVHIDELPKLLGFLNEALGVDIDLGIHENKSTTKLYNDALTAAQTAKIKELYLRDYKNGWCKQQDKIG